MLLFGAFLQTLLSQQMLNPASKEHGQLEALPLSIDVAN
jgi:hypothetical protein